MNAQYPDYAKQQINELATHVLPMLGAYKYRVISYIGLLQNNHLHLVFARVDYLILEPNQDLKFNYNTKSVRSGVYVESINSPLDLDDIFTNIGISIENRFHSFNSDTSSLNAYLDPLDPDRSFNYQFLPTIKITTESGSGLTRELNSLRIKQELKTSEIPYHNIDELLARIGLLEVANAVHDRTIQLSFSPIASFYDFPIFEESRIKIQINTPSDFDIAKLRIGYRAFCTELKRGIISIQSVRQSAFKNINRIDAELQLPDITNVQLILSLDGVVLHQLWATNPNKSLHLIAAAYRHIDPDYNELKKLLSLSNEGEKRGRDFEQGIVYLAHLLGFTTLHFGGSQFQPYDRTIDIAAISPNGNVLAIECTTDIDTANNKLSKLVNRTQNLKSIIAQYGFTATSVQSLFVTSKERNSISGDLRYAAEHDVAVICKEELLQLFGELNGPVNADMRFKNIRDSLERAKIEYAPIRHD